MGESFQLLDILFFAAVAAFLVLRLRSALGRRSGNERRRPNPYSNQEKAEENDTVVHLSDHSNAPEDGEEAPEEDQKQPESPLDAAIAEIRSADPSFDPQAFADGARAAFEMVVSAYASGDRNTLKPLLSNDIYKDFDDAIKNREADGNRLETTVIGFKRAALVEARLEDRIAYVTVKFVSEQINVTYDSENRVIEGDPNTIGDVTDIWEFAHDTRSRDPNWTLVATASPN